MEPIAYFLIFAGVALGIVYNFKLLIIAFSKSPFWGLGCLFFPIVSLIFIAQHWKETQKPFMKTIYSVLLCVIGSTLLAM